MSPNEIDSITHHPGAVAVAPAEAPAEYLEPTLDTGTLPIVEVLLEPVEPPSPIKKPPPRKGVALESIEVPFTAATVVRPLRKRRGPPVPATAHVALVQPVKRRLPWRRYTGITLAVVTIVLGSFVSGWAASLLVLSDWFE